VVAEECQENSIWVLTDGVMRYEYSCWKILNLRQDAKDATAFLSIRPFAFLLQTRSGGQRQLVLLFSSRTHNQSHMESREASFAERFLTRHLLISYSLSCSCIETVIKLKQLQVLAHDLMRVKTPEARSIKCLTKRDSSIPQERAKMSTLPVGR